MEREREREKCERREKKERERDRRHRMILKMIQTVRARGNARYAERNKKLIRETRRNFEKILRDHMIGLRDNERQHEKGKMNVISHIHYS